MDDTDRYRLLGRCRAPRFRSRSRGVRRGAKAPPGLVFALPAGAVISTILARLAHRPLAS